MDLDGEDIVFPLVPLLPFFLVQKQLLSRIVNSLLARFTSGMLLLVAPAVFGGNRVTNTRASRCWRLFLVIST